MRENFMHTVSKRPSIKIFGHRGARGLAPENSLPGYETALAIGVDYVDMDVVMTRDNVVVVYHDPRLNPNFTRDSSGRYVTEKLLIREMTFNELQAYDIGRLNQDTSYAAMFPDQQPVDGTRIPSLRQVIQKVNRLSANRVGFQIELKTHPEQHDLSVPFETLTHAVAEIIKEENIINRTIVQAFDWRCLLRLRDIDPGIQTAFLTDRSRHRRMLSADIDEAGKWTAGWLLKDFNGSIPRMIKAMGGNVWGPEDAQLLEDETLVEQAHTLGLSVIPWHWPEKSTAAGEPDIMEKLIDQGVDGIITDRPDILRHLMKTRNMPLPPAFQKNFRI